MAIRCEVCNIEVQDQYSYSGHLAGKRHAKNVEKEQKKKSLIERSVFVSPLPKNMNTVELMQYFAYYGEIVQYKYGPDHILIEFQNKQSADYLLSKQYLILQGSKVKIAPRIINESRVTSPQKKNSKETINDTEDLLLPNIQTIFNKESTFNDQLNKFINKIILTDAEIKNNYEHTCSQLNKIFKKVYPNCQTFRFGSTVSGLGFKNCDLDIYVDIGQPVIHENSINTELTGVSSKTVFADMKKIIFSKVKLFSNIIPIPRAKIPIIKFKYLPTQISCDISFKNSLAVHNSQLIKFCLTLDPRFHHTMIIIKYWICNFELGSGNKISKYAVTMLFIFYLQQINLLPPLIDMKRQCHPILVEGWQVNYDPRICYLWKERVQNQFSIPELLSGFFKFYAKLDFQKCVVCPIDGKSYEKDVFTDPEKIPNSMDRYKWYLKNVEKPFVFLVSKPMCIQDPNELNHNVGANVSYKLLENFQKCCLAAVEICQKAVEKYYTDLLPSLFLSSMNANKPEAKRPKSLDEKTIINLRSYNYLKVNLPDNFESLVANEDQNSFITENWFELIFNIVKKFFIDIMKFNIQIVSTKPEYKHLKIETESDVHSKDKTIIHCTGDKCLWRKRHGKLNILDPSLSLLEKEVNISDVLLKELEAEKDDKQIKIDLYCYFAKIKEPHPQVSLTLCDNDSTKKIWSELTLFIKSKLTTVVNKTLIHMQQYNKSSKDLNLE